MGPSITIDLPEPLHDRLRRRAELLGTPIQSLILEAVEDSFPEIKTGKRKRVTGPFIQGKGERGPRFPIDENPHDLIFP
jgi:hypothetical protein